MACIDGLQLLYMYRPHFPRPTRAGCPLSYAIPFYIRGALVVVLVLVVVAVVVVVVLVLPRASTR